MFTNCHTNHTVFQNQTATCCHAVVNGTALVHGVAQPQHVLMGKRLSDSALRSKQSARPADPVDGVVVDGVRASGVMPEMRAGSRMASDRRRMRRPGAGDPPAAIWASLVMSRALSS